MFGFVSIGLFIGGAMNPRDEGLGARLRALPLFEPPAGGWLALERRRKSRDLRQSTGWAMAASVLLAVAVGGWQLRHGTGASSSATATVVAMESQSSALEHRLHQARQQAVVWDSERAQRSAELESQLAVVDLQISYADPKATAALWRDRVSLMNALVETHRSAGASAGSGDADGELVEY
jgi:hypothetical protein